MSTELLLAALLALPAAAAPAAPAEEDALTLLEDSLDPPHTAYEGRLEAVERVGQKEERRLLAVRYAPPHHYRRETLDRFGIPEQTVVSDGKVEWTYDRRVGTAWRGAPAERERGWADPDEERALLADNYTAVLEGDETVAGRPCRVLAVRPRRGGPPVQRLWRDAERGLVLQRVVYDPGGEEVSRMRFQTVTYDPPQKASDFRFRPPAGVKVVRSRPAPDALELEEAAKATDLAPRPPAWVPPGYVFESVALLPYRGATILHYRWSDGVDALSLFQAPKRVSVKPAAGGAPRAEKVGAADARLTLGPDGRSLEWAADGRFVLVGRLSLEDLRRVAASVPPEPVTEAAP